MNWMHAGAAAAVLLAGGCAMVPRDHGLSDVRTRTGQEIEWQRSSATADDPRARAMLAGGTLNADRAVAVATVNSPRLQVILAELGIAQADLIEASTISNPMLELETRFPGDPYRPYEITLAQSLVDLVTLPRRRQLGRLGFEAAKLRVSAEVLRFSGEVRDAYYTLLAAAQSLSMTRTNAEAARTSAELAVRQHTAGNITDLDLENEQAVYEQAKLDLARSEEQVLVAREALIRAIGLRDASVPFTIENDFPPLPDRELSHEEIDTMLASRRLDVAIARAEADLARQSVGVERLEALGEIVIDVHREREPDGAKTTGPGIEFPIPIFNTGRAARTRAEAEYLRAAHRLAELTARASSEARTASERVAAARARVEYYRDVVLPRRARIVELTKLEHNSMLIGVYQVLQARQNEANARREFIEAQRDYWTARTNLDRVLNGTGGAEFEMPGGSDERRTGDGDRRGGH